MLTLVVNWKSSHIYTGTRTLTHKRARRGCRGDDEGRGWGCWGLLFLSTTVLLRPVHDTRFWERNITQLQRRKIEAYCPKGRHYLFKRCPAINKRDCQTGSRKKTPGTSSIMNRGVGGTASVRVDGCRACGFTTAGRAKKFM